jgi:hypothetical protein
LISQSRGLGDVYKRQIYYTPFKLAIQVKNLTVVANRLAAQIVAI